MVGVTFLDLQIQISTITVIRLMRHSKSITKTLSPIYYCKRGYFRWAKISQKYWKDLSSGGNFHDSIHISLIKSYGFYFRVGEIFANKAISRKTRKLPPRENFHIYSIPQDLK